MDGQNGPVDQNPEGENQNQNNQNQDGQNQQNQNNQDQQNQNNQNQGGQNQQNQNGQNPQNHLAGINFGYLPFDRKLPKFTGVASGLTVEEWIDEIEGAFQLFNVPAGQRAGLLCRQLEGEARRQVNVLSNAERADVERVKERLHEAFGDTAPVSVIMGEFYSRVQLPRESLQQYALALQELLKRADRRRGQPLVDQDNILRDRFLDGIRDEWLCRQLRREVIRAPAANPRTFREVKEEAFHLSGEWGASSRQVQARQMGMGGEPNVTDELSRLRRDTETSLESIRREIARLRPSNSSSPRYNRPERGSMGRGGPRPAFKWDPEGRPICWKCEEVGHEGYRCPNNDRSARPASAVNPN
ncbi:Hypp4697 [Branchiostoma lanceolatum]|uniref:Hypp4693 protein n=1 Tax=Branchiostoma lanceolatum TaxID=7740 RepID=A0A8K0A966_BRALA|nr:Hypp4693 [Branchiostoma lanceolatum]CAH1271650.1 Hypp4697 [Branchiostoma lanceolatum]